MRRALLFAFSLALLARAEAAPLWPNIGPFGGEARSITSDASGRNIYLLNRRSGVFRSFNGGPWTLVFDATERGVTPTRVVVDPLTSRVYVGTTTGLFRSDDDGATWRLLIGTSIIDAAALGAEVIVSTPRDGLLRSVDRGDTWGGISSPSGTSNVAIIRIDPRAGERLVAVDSGSLFLSDDAGISWRRLQPTNITSIAFGDLVYAGGADGVWGCADDCIQFTASGVDTIGAWRGFLDVTLGDVIASLSIGRVEVVAVIPATSVLSLEGTPSTLLAGTNTGVFATTDGTRWFSRNEGFTGVRITQMAFASGTLVVATAGQGALRRDSGVWTSADVGLPPTVPFLATNGSTLYAAVPAVGVFRSTNQGATWEKVTSGFSPADLFGLAADGDEVVVTTFRSIVQSLDRGMTWQTLTSYPALSATAVAVRGSVMVVADVTSAMISADEGATWQRTDVPSVIHNLAIVGDRIYAGTDAGLFVRNNGAWTLTFPGQIKAVADSGSRVFVASSAGVAFSGDGTHWSFVPGSETLPADVTCVASDGSFVYVGTNGGSVFAISLQQRRRAARR
ncbi:MAG: hypothetical protein M3041_05760 [Acidobacteriota bacterium]|nr:hypothetical protein [Acidobacteriota bacterium]